MTSMTDIKRRRETIQNTEQITKAMKLVSTAKLQKSRAKAELSRPYSDLMYDTIHSILNGTGQISHKYLENNGSLSHAVLAITSNRGLAGGYNHNIVRMVLGHEGFVTGNTKIYAAGRKGKDAFAKKGYEIVKDYSEVINEPMYQDAADITSELLEAYGRGEIGSVYLAYTSFQNTVTHIPILRKLLPITEGGTEKGNGSALMTYEPDEEEVLDSLIPRFVSSLIFSALLESAASEHGARMAAMDSAAGNAEEMIGELTLLYNRARQSSITQELTEIIAGASAIT